MIRSEDPPRKAPQVLLTYRLHMEHHFMHRDTLPKHCCPSMPLRCFRVADQIAFHFWLSHRDNAVLNKGAAMIRSSSLKKFHAQVVLVLLMVSLKHIDFRPGTCVTTLGRTRQLPQSLCHLASKAQLRKCKSLRLSRTYSLTGVIFNYSYLWPCKSPGRLAN